MGVGVGFGLGFGVLLGDGVCDRAGEEDGDGLGGVELGLDAGWVGSAGVSVGKLVGPGLSMTTTFGGGGAPKDGVEVADGVGVVDGVGLGEAERVGLLDAEAELFGTTTSGVVPGFAPTMKLSFGWPDAACRGVGEIALEPMTTTLAVAAEVTPASSAAVTTVLVEVAANAEGSLNNPASFMPSPPRGPFGRAR